MPPPENFTKDYTLEHKEIIEAESIIESLEPFHGKIHFWEVINMTIKYKYYICCCGKRIIPVTNPSKCPHCGRVTCLK